MLHISLFSGIGGFDLAAEWAGWTNIVSCEINPFGRRHLEYYWPDAYHHTDIHTLTIEKINEELTKRHGANWRTNDIVLTGGFPCQPYSLAGKRLGKEDERHLWPEMLRVIQEVKPTWIVGENVFGIVNWSDGLVFNEVQADLETQGYEVQAYVLPACAADAPHRRDRVWIVAHANDLRGCEQEKSEKQQRRTKTGTTSEAFSGEKRFSTKSIKNTMRSGCLRGQPEQEGTKDGQQRNIGTGNCNGFCLSEGFAANTDCKRHEKRITTTVTSEPERQHSKTNFERGQRDWHDFPTESPVCSRDDGLSGRLDGITFSKWRNESIKAAGNAIVPQIAYRIFETINQYNKQTP